METIYLLICDAEVIHSVTGESLCKSTTVWGAYKTLQKAEENKAWYEKCNKEANEKYQHKDKVRFYIQESTLK